jgi:hypothetical protein
VAKRSPILGYNHNVRYRGLIFHVQTEDSGLLQPHLFTHLFHSGVIVSTRKLVYDPGSDEGAIKSLMQAQHKAVMKDLRRGMFDDKIDQYLGGTPGLLPRGSISDESQPAEPMRDSQIDLARPSEPSIEIIADAAPLDQTQPTPEIEAAHEPMDTPESLPVFAEGPDDIALGHFVPPAGQQPELSKSRTSTASRGSVASTIRSAGPPSTPPPPSSDLDAPTNLDSGAVAAAINAAANATIRTPIPQMARTMTPPLVGAPTVNEIMSLDLDDDHEPAREPSGRSRIPRDTDVVLPGIDLDPSDGVPGLVGAPPTTRQPADSVPPMPPPPSSSRASVGASALPPSRPVTRPPARPAMTPPQVVSRPITRDKDRPREAGDSDAIEVYAPAPPSADPPPGLPERERPGQYSQHKRVSQKMPALEHPARERSGAVPIPPGLGRPGNRPPAVPPPRPPGREPPPLPREARPTPSQPMAIPQQMRSDPSSGSGRPRTPTPGRSSPPPSRTGSASIPNSGVVMTRPAVIVGAPAKPQQSGRVRKAREDEGRGFGQGLISEKSLDEVILAYLSEDADDK